MIIIKAVSEFINVAICCILAYKDRLVSQSLMTGWMLVSVVPLSLTATESLTSHLLSRQQR